MQHYADYVKQAVKCGADFIVSGAGLPVDLPEYAAGSPVKLGVIVSTEKSAAVILKYWPGNGAGYRSGLCPGRGRLEGRAAGNRTGSGGFPAFLNAGFML